MQRTLCGVLTILSLVAGGCNLGHLLRPYLDHTDPNVTQPPSDDLLLWLEADDPQGATTTLQLNAGGRVERWNDHRGNGTAAVALAGFAQRPTTAMVRLPTGLRRQVNVLNCAAADGQVCAYSVGGNGIMDGTPFTILGVVKRTSNRGDNYFVMTTGLGCNPAFGGTGCTSNTALHLGWSGGDTLRLGQYDNDAFFGGIADFDSLGPQVSLITGYSPFVGSSVKEVALLQEGINAGTTGGDGRPLDHSGVLMVGGTGFSGGDGPAVPDWKFEGEIIALLVYRRALSVDEANQAQSYLRNGFGPD